VCYLGVVHTKTAQETRDRVLFWKYTVPKMDQLNLPPDTRVRLEAKLSEVIPKADKHEIDRYDADANKRYRQLLERIGSGK
jgi:hypothetical protein